MLYKPDWEATQQAFIRWWAGQGMMLWLEAELPEPRYPADEPPIPSNPEAFWNDLDYRIARHAAHLARTAFLGESFPYFDTVFGPGSLGILLGSEPGFAMDTVWYNPCIPDPDSYGPIRFNPNNNRWLDVHQNLIAAGLKQAQGQYPVCLPDLIENLDVLAALRGDTPLLFDLVERPAWVSNRLAEINESYFQVFDRFYAQIKFAGGNVFTAFNLWGPGKTAKVQCDISASISPRMFRRFVVPHLETQCRWLDFAMYHLDGTTCLQHLDALLEIDALKAIEYTPQAGRPQGGSPEWYGLYRRIRSANKSVQAVGLEPDTILPLVDAVGPQGLFIIPARAFSLPEAENLLKQLEPYRS